jgi:integrase
VASITQSGDGWRAFIRRAGYRSRSKTFATKRQAQAWAREVEAVMDSRKYAEPKPKLKAVTVASLFERFRDEEVPKRKGAKWETVRINKLIKEADFIPRRLDQLTPNDIRDWRDGRLKQVSAASVRREMNLIGSIFSHALKEWDVGLTSNPVKLVQRPTESRGRTRRWTDEEFQRVQQAAGWHEALVPTKGMDYVGWAMIVALETAMRLGELCKLKVEDFIPGQRHVVLHETKNGDIRRVPLSKKALAALSHLVKGKKTTEKIFAVTSETLGLYFREARNLAGLAEADLRFHDIRHESTTRLSKKFSNVVELSAVTGHRDLQSLKRYFNPTPMELAERLD